MRLTPRRRAVIAILVTWPFAWLYVEFAVPATIDVLRVLRGAYPTCSGWFGGLAYDCNSRGAVLIAPFEVLIASVVAVLLAWLLARWVTWPIRSMAATVDRLGPTSLGMRLDPTGPKDETRALARAINTMLDRVAEGYEAQRRFAANASHELRTPLATQRALIEVSLGDALTPDQLDLLSRQLLATNERNESLIEGLLVLAETDQGLVSNSPQRLDELVRRVVESWRPTATERHIRLDLEAVPTVVLGEEPLLERLVTNLVQNAIKYNDDGGWVRVWVSDGGRLRVANSGPRVEPAQVDALFEPFRRARGDRLDHGGGVGLGLTIARSVVAAHHGSIVAHANPEGGLTIDVALPTG